MEVYFLNSISVKAIDGEKWLLIEEFSTGFHQMKENYLLTVPPMFVTDFCSVPRLPFAYLFLGGLARYAGLMHDALYSNWHAIQIKDIETGNALEYTRQWADNALLEALKKCGISMIKRWAMYLAVRSFGWRYYKKDTNLTDKPKATTL